MLRRGEVYENSESGVRAVILLGTAETAGQRLVLDLHLRRAGPLWPRHLHPSIRERCTVLSGRVCFLLDNESFIANLGETIDIPPGTVHDWWNAGIYEARVTVDIQPAARFEAYFLNAFGLAQDGQTNPQGMPRLLQQVLLDREFSDVIRFTWPSSSVRRILFPVLAPLAWLLGYRGVYDEYLNRPPAGTYQLERSEKPVESS